MGTAYNDYTEIVASICQVTLKTDNARTVAPIIEETVVSKEFESKIQGVYGFEDLFQGLQWVTQSVSNI